MSASMLPRSGRPLASILLIGVCLVIYACMLWLQWQATGKLRFGFSAQFLAQIGGSTRSGILLNQDWYRLFCAPLYHADAMHIFMNMFALFICGRFLEPFIGRSWFLLGFLVSALSGIFFSVVFSSEGVVSVGASGGIMGLLVMAALATKRIQETSLRKDIFRQMFVPLISTLIPSIPYFLACLLRFLGKDLPLETSNIDHAAHLGGAIGGLLLGFAMLSAWPAFESRPFFQKGAFLASIVWILICVLALLQGLGGIRIL